MTLFLVEAPRQVVELGEALPDELFHRGVPATFGSAALPPGEMERLYEADDRDRRDRASDVKHVGHLRDSSCERRELTTREAVVARIGMVI